jgi:hypothetical protein
MGRTTPLGAITLYIGETDNTIRKYDERTRYGGKEIVIQSNCAKIVNSGYYTLVLGRAREKQSAQKYASDGVNLECSANAVVRKDVHRCKERSQSC